MVNSAEIFYGPLTITQIFQLPRTLFYTRIAFWIPHDLPIITTLLQEFHAGVTKTTACLTENFYWPRLREDVARFVANCKDCQVTKYEAKKMAGLLCPLPIPYRPWDDLSLDFIVGLPAYKGNTVILGVVDRFSKGIHLGMLPTAHTANMVASLFMNTVVKLHGLPHSLVSDHDPLFISQFWHELFRLSGTLLRLSSAYHPQSDGQTEMLNRVIEQYLRAFVHSRQGTWGKYLPWVEWSHNSAWSASTGSTPYEITYGRKLFTFPEYLARTSKIDAVDALLVDREMTFQAIRKKLVKAQESMKKYVDAKRRDVVYQPNDWVLVKL